MGDMLKKRPEMFKEILQPTNTGTPEYKKMFKEILDRLGIAADLESSEESAAVQQFGDYLDNEFAFSSYLALSVEHGVLDSIRIHRVTWCALMLLFVVFACVIRWAHIPLPQLMPYFILLVFTSHVMMTCAIRRKKAAIMRMAQRMAETKCAQVVDGHRTNSTNN